MVNNEIVHWKTVLEENFSTHWHYVILVDNYLRITFSLANKLTTNKFSIIIFDGILQVNINANKIEIIAYKILRS